MEKVMSLLLRVIGLRHLRCFSCAMWRILLCLAMVAGDDDVVVDPAILAEPKNAPQEPMSAEQLRRIHQAVDKNQNGKAGTEGDDGSKPTI